MKEWSKDELEAKLMNAESFYLYLYTPMCGTCQMAKKMLTVVQELKPKMDIGQSNLNYFADKAMEWAIESVPCLLQIKGGIIKEKVYAFRSVEYLLEKVKE